MKSMLFVKSKTTEIRQKKKMKKERKKQKSYCLIFPPVL